MALDFNKPHILLPIIAAMILSMSATVFVLHESSNKPLLEPKSLEKHHCVRIIERGEPTRYPCFFTEKEAVDLMRTCTIGKGISCDQIYKGWFVRHENGLLSTSKTISAIEKSFGKPSSDSKPFEKRYCVDAVHHKRGVQPCQDSKPLEKRYCVQEIFVGTTLSYECFSTEKKMKDALNICRKESASGVGCYLRYNEPPNKPLPDSKPLEKHHCVRVAERGEPIQYSCFFTEIEAVDLMRTCPFEKGITCYQMYKGDFVRDWNGCAISTSYHDVCEFVHAE